MIIEAVCWTLPLKSLYWIPILPNLHPTQLHFTQIHFTKIILNFQRVQWEVLIENAFEGVLSFEISKSSNFTISRDSSLYGWKWSFHLPRSVSGYFSTVLRQVSNRRPDTLTISFSSWVVRSLRCTAGARGRALFAMGTQPIAAALANGSQAATFAMFGSILNELFGGSAYDENDGGRSIVWVGRLRCVWPISSIW